TATITGDPRQLDGVVLRGRPGIVVVAHPVIIRAAAPRHGDPMRAGARHARRRSGRRARSCDGSYRLDVRRAADFAGALLAAATGGGGGGSPCARARNSLPFT